MIVKMLDVLHKIAMLLLLDVGLFESMGRQVCMFE